MVETTPVPVTLDGASIRIGERVGRSSFFDGADKDAAGVAVDAVDVVMLVSYVASIMPGCNLTTMGVSKLFFKSSSKDVIRRGW